MNRLAELKKNSDLAWAQSYRKEVRSEFACGMMAGLVIGTSFGIFIAAFIMMSIAGPTGS